TFLAGVLAITLVAVSAPLRQDPAAREFDHALQRLRAVLNPKEGRAGSFIPLADDLLGRAGLYPHKAGEVYFLAGVAYQRLADENPPEQSKIHRQRALTLLEEALAAGLPEPEQPLAQFHLGQLLFHQGTDWRRAISLLAQSVDQQPLDQ